MSKKVLDDICDGCDRYCLLKLLVSSGISEMQAEQYKCIDRLKYERSEKEGKDIGMEAATEIWIKEGFAERFRKVYRDGMTNGELYNLVLERK